MARNQITSKKLQQANCKYKIIEPNGPHIATALHLTKRTRKCRRKWWKKTQTRKRQTSIQLQQAEQGTNKDGDEKKY